MGHFSSVGVLGMLALLVSCASTPTSIETLGSEQNPVRVRGPDGERAYLRRLRSGDGTPPQFDRRGSGGPGPDGHIIDFYSVVCPGQEPDTIIMDMYHRGGEGRAVPGYTIVAG